MAARRVDSEQEMGEYGAGEGDTGQVDEHGAWQHLLDAVDGLVERQRRAQVHGTDETNPDRVLVRKDPDRHHARSADIAATASTH